MTCMAITTVGYQVSDGLTILSYPTQRHKVLWTKLTVSIFFGRGGGREGKLKMTKQ